VHCTTRALSPIWVNGIAIGAVNAGLIAGNEPENRMARLREFWRRVEHGPWHQALLSMPGLGSMAANWLTMAGGIGAFFQPNPMAFVGAHVPQGPEAAAYYSTEPWETTLGGLVDFGMTSRSSAFARASIPS